jgi:molecular chaperone GrpE
VQKTSKRSSKKELIDRLKRKNDILAEMERKLEKLQQLHDEKEDRMIRKAAEFENYKKRMRREWELLQQNANAELMREILGVMDDFDRALEAAEEEEGHFYSGIKLIHAGLVDALKRAGLREIETEGQRFDPQYHEAISEVESDDVAEGYIAHVVRKGYMLNNALLRPARVVVAKKKQE